MTRETAEQFLNQLTDDDIKILFERLPELIERCWKEGLFCHQGSEEHHL